MDIRCPRCDVAALFVGNEAARYFYQCEKCNRVWSVLLTALPPLAPSGPPQVRVMVVDDSDQLVGLVATWLADDGYAVVTATSGREALDSAAVHSPDIVLLDLIMPPPDGFDVCEALRQQRHPPEVILMTGGSDPAHLRRAVDCGVAAVLRKPLTLEAVLDAVSNAARHSERRAHRSETSSGR